MSIVAILICWYAVGVLISIWALYLIDPVFLGKDVVFVGIASFVGPLNVIGLFLAIAHRRKKSGKLSWLDKRVWPRPPCTARDGQS